jgi:type II secretory pathway component PulF
MIYPVLLFSVAILAVFLLFTNILPGIFEIVQTFGDTELPAMTKAMIAMTDFMQKNTIPIIVGVFLI